MHRTQIQLTEQQLAALRALSAERHRSVADLIREGVDQYVKNSSQVDREEVVKQAKSIAGKFASGLSDVAARHDDYLAEDFR